MGEVLSGVGDTWNVKIRLWILYLNQLILAHQFSCRRTGKSVEISIMSTTTHAIPHKLSDDLNTILKSNPGKLTVGDIFNSIGERGFGVALLMTSLPSALPLPAPGYSTPFGILLAVLSVQLLLGHKKPWLPQWAARRTIPEKLCHGMSRGLTQFFSKMERFIKPRWSLFSGRIGHILAAIIIFIMACLMILPIPGTNTAPAGVIFLLAVGLLEEDGLFLTGASILGIVLAIFYAFALTMIFYYGASGISEVIAMIKNWSFS